MGRDLGAVSRRYSSAAHSEWLAVIVGLFLTPGLGIASSNWDRLLNMQPLVVSYYWPIARENGDPMDFAMATPNIIDVLSSDVGGTQEVREYWRRHGKVLLNRVYPFRTYTSEQDVYDYFAANMTGADGISIDEVVAHHLTVEQQRILISVLRRLRAAFPGQFIFVWDASLWSAETGLLAQALRDYCDLVMLEVYLLRSQPSQGDFRTFEQRRNAIEQYAPGIRAKTIIGIGADKKTCMSTDTTCVQRLVAQVQFLGSVRRSTDLRGLAIYAPIYLTVSGQHALDQAIREAFPADAASQDQK